MRGMSHPLVLALFPTPAAAAEAAVRIHGLGVGKEHISVVTRNHDEERSLADRIEATPGVELEDSRSAGILGELSGWVFAAAAIVTPGMGPIVAAGPLAAELGEAAGHAAGSLASVLQAHGLPRERAQTLQQMVAQGAVLLGVHAGSADADPIRERLSSAGATRVETMTWT
jgi:hypothetical protein